MNYKINLIPAEVRILTTSGNVILTLYKLLQYPLIASVSNAAHDSEKGYLKFVKEGRKEIEILQYLTGIDSPINHTISGVEI